MKKLFAYVSIFFSCLILHSVTFSMSFKEKAAIASEAGTYIIKKDLGALKLAISEQLLKNASSVHRACFFSAFLSHKEANQNQKEACIEVFIELMRDCSQEDAKPFIESVEKNGYTSFFSGQMFYAMLKRKWLAYFKNLIDGYKNLIDGHSNSNIGLDVIESYAQKGFAKLDTLSIDEMKELKKELDNFGEILKKEIPS